MSGFRRLVRAEWTKFRTVRGWVLGLVAAVALTAGLGLQAAAGSHASCGMGAVEVVCPAPPVGPGGEAVTDRFFFVHQRLDGDGAITARVASMTGRIRKPDERPGVTNLVPGVVPWAKAGVMVKDGTRQGAAYAAVMVTGGHGVRMQHGFTEDRAGTAASAPVWLRLVRSGDELTGFESPDGRTWAEVGTATLTGLPESVRIGLFVTSPGDLTFSQDVLGGTVAAQRFTEATAAFDQVGVRGAATGGAWSHDDVGVTVGPGGAPHHPGRHLRQGDTFTVTGTGDIAPAGDEGGMRAEQTLTGLLAGLVVVVVVAAGFVTAEYRGGLIRITLAAAPGRGRVLAAKAVVVGTATFAAGLAAAAVTVPLGVHVLEANGNRVLPVSLLTGARVVVGSAALLALAAVLALALGALLRRGVLAVAVAVAVIVLPYFLATVSVLPLEAARWLLRLTPAAGFAVQQTVTEYPQVAGHYAPVLGYYPLPPWGGLAVLAAYAALALGLAVAALRRRDA
ncbi:hypothetical protein [Nonomuraea sp. NPDC003214]